jgi:hypothetical protein
MRHQTVLFSAALLAAALVAAGCGASATVDKARDAIDPVARAATATAGHRSARITTRAEVSVGGETLTVTGEGVVRFKPAGGKITAKTRADGREITIDEILDGAKLYMRLPAEARRTLPRGKSWVLVDLDRALKGTGIDVGGSLGQDPASSLKLLQTVGNARVVGHEDVDGIPTTRYHAALDYRKIADDPSVAQDVRDTARAAQRFMRTPVVPIDVWVDESKTVRREDLVVTTKGSGGQRDQTQDITTELHDFGAATDAITPPDADEVVDRSDTAARAVAKAG